MRRYRKLKKAKKLLLHCYHRFQKVGSKLSLALQESVRSKMLDLQDAILHKDIAKAETASHALDALYNEHLRKNLFQRIRDSILGIGVALCVAILIRQMWFELYEIPTGSMRPTFKEQDRLSVSKTDFGVNYPLRPGHFYFNPELLQRSGIIIFTTEGMDFRDADTVYFYIFPGKKLLVKRLMGKPGDTLYFYGGQMYGIDSQGKDISRELQLPELSKIDHIPFIAFEGTHVGAATSTIPGVYSPITIYQMNEPIAKLYALGPNRARGQLLTHQDVSYSELWGMGNFATARLLTRDQVLILTNQDLTLLEDGVLYLELKHHPSLAQVKMGLDGMHRLRPQLQLLTSIIPLQEHHLKVLMNNLYTSRFVVEEGIAHRYGINPKRYGALAIFPHLPRIPNGTYEFYYGTAYRVGGLGITHTLPPTHPLYRFDPQRMQLFFNLGMEFDTRYSPQSKEQVLSPSRYAYFRDGDLYLLGAPVLLKDDPTLLRFIEREEKKKETNGGSYVPFVDAGPPLLANGSLDIEKIQTCGLKIPPKAYLALGDNHAASGDSREFGFVPEANLRGGPSFIFWPPGPRFGAPNQPPYPWFNPGRLVIWIIGAVGFGTWGFVHRRRSRLPLHF